MEEIDKLQLSQLL